MPTDDDCLARELAETSGRLLLELRESAVAAQGPDVLRREGDRRSHEFLAAELARRRPGDAVLSEEGADDPARLSASRVWIIDPLDGTREFGEPGRSDWAVHVALWEAGAGHREGSGGLTAGAVALPARQAVLSTAGPPAAADGHGDGQRLRLVVSRSRPPAFVERLAALLGADLLPLGSAGAKAAAVIRGEADAYVHSGGQYEWDSAAPVAVARAAGLHASRTDGSSLRYNSAQPSLPDILICRASLASSLIEAIRSAS
jgi:3'(2'), 5'-bisphosphate nucleotidase